MSEARWNRKQICFKTASSTNCTSSSSNENHELLVTSTTLAALFPQLSFGSWIELRRRHEENFDAVYVRLLRLKSYDAEVDTDSILQVTISNDSMERLGTTSTEMEFEWRSFDFRSKVSEAVEIELEYVKPDDAQEEVSRSSDEPTVEELYRKTLMTVGPKLLCGRFVNVGEKFTVSWRKQVLDSFRVKAVTSSSAESLPFGIIADTSKIILADDYSKTKNNSIASDRLTQYLMKEETFTLMEECANNLVGGMDEYVHKVLRMIVLGITWKARCDQMSDGERYSSDWPTHGAIVTGKPGTGKSALANAICTACEKVEISVRTLSVPTVFSKSIRESKMIITEFFEKAIASAPCVVVLDEIQSIAAVKSGDVEKVLFSVFLREMDRIWLQEHQVFVIGIAPTREELHPMIIDEDRLSLNIAIRPLSAKQRYAVLRQYLTDIDGMTEQRISEISTRTAGYVGADIVKLCREALAIQLKLGLDPKSLCLESVWKALDSTRPTVLQKGFSLEIPQVPLSSFYGIEDAITLLNVALLQPLQDFEMYPRMGVSTPTGFLLYGAEGTGKTMLAHAIATEARGLANFLPVKCSELISKVVGDTEKALSEIFQTAREAAPCIIFFDQIECLAPPRGYDSSTEKTFDRLLSTLLVEMDGALSSGLRLSSDNRRLEDHVVVLATTNHPSQLDPAILRPGRFDQHILLELPDEEARKLILMHELSSMPLSLDAPTAAELNTVEKVSAWIAKRTANESAAVLKNLCRDIAMQSLRENISLETIELQHILATVKAHGYSL